MSIPITDALPLAAGQKSLWFMQQVLPDSAVYHIAFTVRIVSPIQVSALRDALQAILDRHDSLRTVFLIDSHGELMQSVSRSQAVAFEVIDTTGISSAEIDATVTAEYRKPFDLAAGPLFRSHLFTDRAKNHVLLLAAHHLVFDALSLGIVVTELLELYRAGQAGDNSSLLPVKARYREFAEWQSQMLAGPEGEAHLAFWRGQLEGALPVLDLPTDYPRPSRPRARGASLWFPIDPTITHNLRALATDLSVYPFDIFLAAWHILLSRYSGQTDISVGFVTAARPHLRYARTTGLFSNTIVSRARLDDNPAFSDFVQRQHKNLESGLTHQDYPFALLAERLRTARVPGFMPLTQVLFTYFMSRTFQLSELSVTGHEPVLVNSDAFTMQSYGSKQDDIEFDLALSVAEGKRCWSRLQFDIDLFDRRTIERLAEHYVNLLRALASSPSQTVRTIPLLGEAEREKILVHWNQTQSDLPADVTACSLFEARVAAEPDRIAVVCGNQQVTYAELNARADSLAAYLLRCGTRPGSLVGISMARSIDALAALLSVWKAGAAYVPLDPNFPKARLDLIMEDAAPCTIITEETLASLPQVSGTSPPSRQTDDADLAYVIYTSGSTGRPKGVRIPHRALTNFLLSLRRRPGLNEKDVLLAVTTFSFDIAALELFLPLITGATVAIAERDATLDGRELAREIEQRGITVMQATPATWRLLIDSGWRGCPRLKALCGGEALPRELAQNLLPKVGSLWNMYGPTETTVWSAMHEVAERDDPIPLGRPIDNTTFYILDSNLQPVPIGVAGELHIGGAGLARGYHNDPELTNARFIEHPFLPGERLYKTGDLCRYRRDGSVLFLGRLDTQVKLRGHRIELAEIESVLARNSRIQEAAVILNEEIGSPKRLIAYLIASKGAPQLPASTLREYLSMQLPDYMIPSAFVYLDVLPLTPNFKLDRKALVELRARPAIEEQAYVAPRTPTETAVAEIWTDIFKLPQISVNDRFDELGGDSLSFALMTIRAGTRLNIKIPVRMDDEILTVAAFAHAADGMGKVAPSATLIRPDPLAKTWYGQMLVRTCDAIVRCLARIEVDGFENIPAHGPGIVAANHISLFDLVMLGSVLSRLERPLPVTLTFLIADKWRWLARPYASQLGNTIYIRRGQGDSEALEAARSVLAGGGAIAITPEGHPTRGALSRARPGVGYLAFVTGAPIWPLAIFGHDRIAEFWKKLRRVPVQIKLGKSFSLTQCNFERRDYQTHTDMIMRAIADLMPHEYHGVYATTEKSADVLAQDLTSSTSDQPR